LDHYILKPKILAMIMDDDILSAERVSSSAEILDEYHRRCEEAAETHARSRCTARTLGAVVVVDVVNPE
jgi:hypothetical protein